MKKEKRSLLRNKGVQSLLAGEMSAQEVYDYIVEAAHSEFGAENCVSGKI